MKLHRFVAWHPRLTILRLLALMLVLMWSRPAFCGEIHYAAMSNDVQRVKALLSNNPALVSSKDATGKTPLHLAAESACIETMELLLANKADVNAKDNGGRTPLQVVISSHPSRAEALQLLLANKADVNVKDNAGRTPLDVSMLQLRSPQYVRDGRIERDIELLRQYGGRVTIDPNKDLRADDGAVAKRSCGVGPRSESPIHRAAWSNDVEQVKALLSNNPALVSSKDATGQTPLHLAAESACVDTTELLLANKADVNAKDNEGWTPLHRVVSQISFQERDTRPDVIRLLLANKADVNAKNNDGQAPLHVAALGGRRQLAELLLANKADVNAKDNRGRTPLDVAYDELLAIRFVSDGRIQTSLIEFLRQHGGRADSARENSIEELGSYAGRASVPEKLLLDLRAKRERQVRVRPTEEIESKRYETSLGVVTIAPVANTTPLKDLSVGDLGAVATLGSDELIARAEVMRINRDGTVQIKETQFRRGDSQHPAYVGMVYFSADRKEIISTLRISGSKLYEVFVDWEWRMPVSSSRVITRPGRLTVIAYTDFRPIPELSGQEHFIFDLRAVRTHTGLIDALGTIVAKKYETPVGVVTLIPTESVDTSQIDGAVAQLGTDVIARARILYISMEDAEMEIEETQFRRGDPQPAYVGTVRINRVQNAIIYEKRISGTKLYETFVDWAWAGGFSTVGAPGIPR